MDSENNEKYRTHKIRAIFKAAGVLLCVAVAVVILADLISTDQIDMLKHHLDLWTIIALMVIINLLSFAIIFMLYTAYRWIKGDVKPDRDAEFSE